jgi:hypothetical protein
MVPRLDKLRGSRGRVVQVWSRHLFRRNERRISGQRRSALGHLQSP